MCVREFCVHGGVQAGPISTTLNFGSFYARVDYKNVGWASEMTLSKFLLCNGKNLS